jgi:hypothetical protein
MIIESSHLEIKKNRIENELYAIAEKYAPFFQTTAHELIARYSWNKDNLDRSRFSSEEKYEKFMEFANEMEPSFSEHQALYPD